MDLKQLEYMVAIADMKSLSRAAERFYVSQSALSQQLAKLEKELNVSLFVRGKQGFSLTPAGHIYIDNARRILAIRDETMRSLSAFSQTQGNCITVGAAAGRSTTLFAQVYDPFMKAYPDYEISLQEHPSVDAERLLSLGKLDIAVSLMMLDELSSLKQISTEILFKEKLLLVVPRNHPLVPKDYVDTDIDNCPSIDPELFRNERFVLPSTRTKLRHRIDEIFSSYDIVPQVAFEVLNTSFICKTLNQGDLCTVISSGFLKKNPNIAYFSIEDKMTMAYCVCWNSSHRLSDAEKYFIELCKQQAPKV
ncbi:MAG: LysR family transcriptional regulator [Clostridia bacterium]|nr:LysR family transcriptional regulator [Clostridia bacterium]